MRSTISTGNPQIMRILEQSSLSKGEMIISDASELSSARFSSDSARAGGFSARLGSAREIFEPARLEKNGLM